MIYQYIYVVIFIYKIQIPMTDVPRNLHNYKAFRMEIWHIGPYFALDAL